MALIAETGSILTSGDWAGYGFRDAREPVANFSHATASLVETAVMVAPADPSGDARWRRPITGIAACCARAANGPAAAEQAMILMNWPVAPQARISFHCSTPQSTMEPVSRGDRSGAALDV